MTHLIGYTKFHYFLTSPKVLCNYEQEKWKGDCIPLQESTFSKRTDILAHQEVLEQEPSVWLTEQHRIEKPNY